MKAVSALLPGVVMVIGLLLAADACRAAVYSWRDAQGVQHFSQTPPTGRSYRRLRLAPLPSTAAPGITGIENGIGVYDRDRKTRDQAREARLHARAERLAACAQARSRTRFLEEKTARRLFTRQTDGSQARMSETEFRRQLDQAQAAVRANCGN